MTPYTYIYIIKGVDDPVATEDFTQIFRLLDFQSISSANQNRAFTDQWSSDIEWTNDVVGYENLPDIQPWVVYRNWDCSIQKVAAFLKRSFLLLLFQLLWLTHFVTFLIFG